MNGSRHLLIRASAGTGKTHALTDRYVALLAAGARPDRIVALTFTRKAAGEFFSGILTKLARAARDPSRAAALAQATGRADLGPADFGRLLRVVVDALPWLRLGTLDGFFARLVRAFPLELGLTGDFEVLGEAAQRTERRRVLRRLLLAGRASAAERRAFHEAFKRATFGVEEKRPGLALHRFLDLHHERLRAAPDERLWGDQLLIWPEGQPWLGPTDAPPARATLRVWLDAAAVSDRARGRWEDFLAALASWAPGAPVPPPVEYVVERALPQLRALESGRAELRLDRGLQPLDADAARALAVLVRHVAGGELARRLERTRGLHAVLAQYEALHDELVRRAGRLTFGDIEALLRTEAGTSLAAERRLLLDYRLDGGIDHWLLDEFQDTSRGQWGVLRNLVDEALQDPDGRRTFFCVGDEKQAIYAWRSGDARLMGEILDRYNQGQEETIATRPLDASWRSGPPVIAFVNAAFGEPAALARVLPGEAVARWSAGWRRHETAVSARDGQAALLFAPDLAGRRRATLELLRAVDPLARGLSCAVLVQTNDQALELADFLRREGGMPAVAESDLAIATDNPFGVALLALFRAAAHPGDSLARELVLMSPLAGALAAEGLTEAEDWSRRVLAEVQAGGFERAAAGWMRRLGAVVSGDAFIRLRARQFLAGAAEFDAGGSREVGEFLEFMERYRVREPEVAGVVRVMTIHKAKGLGFDVVILPELEGGGLDAAREGLALARDRCGNVAWVLDLPASWLASSDPVLAAQGAAAREESAFEALALLYVALTRAKRGLYAVVEPPGKSTAKSFPRLLVEALGAEARPLEIGHGTFLGSWSAGNPAWMREQSAGEPPIPEPAPVILSVAAPVRLPARRALAKPVGSPRGEALLGSALAARRRGAEIHDLLAQVEWAVPAQADRWREAWVALGASEEAVAAAASCLAEPSLAPIWARPADVASAEVWRERSFEAVLGGVWFSGVFDRVVVTRDATGLVRTAVVIDFKTDRLAAGVDPQQAAETHRTQLDIYRRAVARLTELPETAVEAQVVFVAPPRLAALAPP